jgi:ABC-2 type transport system permease protein
MRKFLVLVKKEVRELLTPQMLAPLLITVLIFVFIGRVVGGEAEKAESRQVISLVDLDNTGTSRSVAEILSKSKFRVDLYLKEDIPSAIERAKQKGQSSVLVLPRGFESGLKNFKPQPVETYTIVRNFSFLGARNTGSVKVALATINDYLSSQLILASAPNSAPQELKNPVRVEEHVIVGEKMAAVSPEQVMAFVTSQTTFIPIVLFIVIIFAAQMVATAVATEKENKTLETLLSTPINRSALVSAKMVAAGLIALATAIVYMFSFRYYMTGLSGGGIGGVNGGGFGTAVGSSMSGAMRELGLVLSPASYAVLGISLFFGILCALAIAIILGAFAEEVKSIQALIAPLMIVVLIPYLLVMFLDISTLSPVLKYVVLAIPFSHPFLAAPNLFLRDYAGVFYGIAYEAAFFAVFVYIAGRIFSSDRILTMKLRLKRSRSASI